MPKLQHGQSDLVLEISLDVGIGFFLRILVVLINSNGSVAPSYYGECAGVPPLHSLRMQSSIAIKAPRGSDVDAETAP